MRGCTCAVRAFVCYEVLITLIFCASPPSSARTRRKKEIERKGGG